MNTSQSKNEMMISSFPLNLAISFLILIMFLSSSFNAVLNICAHSTALAFRPNTMVMSNNNTNANASSAAKSDINHQPVAENMSITSKDDLPTVFLLKGTDQDEADKLTFTIVNEAVRGFISNFNPSTGTGIYQKFSSSTGGDVFTYKVTDSKGAVSKFAIVTVTFSEK